MRTLAIVSFSFSAAIFVSVYLLPFGYTPAAALIFFALGIVLRFSGEKWLKPLAFAVLGAAVGFGWFYLHDLQTVVPAHLLEGTTQTVEARILEYPQNYDSSSRVVVSLESESLPRIDAYLYDAGKSVAGTAPGDRIRFEARLSPSDQRYGKAYDGYTARDIYLKLNTDSEVFLLQRGSALSRLPVRIRHILTERVDALFSADAAVFMKSLLLGDKADLYQNEKLYLSLSRAGNMHALAVSGVQYLFFGFYRIARKPVNWALFGHRPRRCTPKLRFT